MPDTGLQIQDTRYWQTSLIPDLKSCIQYPASLKILLQKLAQVKNGYYICAQSLKNQKKHQMKKVFAILALATVMTACNNESEKTDTPATGDTVKTETPAAPAVVDTAANAMKAIADTAAAKVNQVVDTAKKGVEKVVEKAKEAVKH